MVWERRSYNDGSSLRCTVKFRGVIPQWGTAVALGVEWDEPSRGRNSGSLNGVQYFACRVPNAGSFVRESREAERSISFAEAVSQKYLQPGTDLHIQISASKTVETYGFDKAERRFADLPSLELLSLDSSLVKSLYWPDFRQFCCLKKLDLGHNLIEGFSELTRFVSYFPVLDELVLTGNRFLFADSIGTIVPNVRTLNLTNCALEDKEILTVLKHFPNLTTLELGYNLLTTIPNDLPKSLTHINLSHNLSITEMKDIPRHITGISLRGCSVKSIEGHHFLPAECDFRETNLLHEGSDGLTVVDWDSVSQLAEQNIQNLSFLGAYNLSQRDYVIARCGSIIKLDGTDVNPKTRDDAERFTIAAVLQHKHPAIPERRWQQMIAKHGMPYLKSSESIEDRLISFYVDGRQLLAIGDAPIRRLQTLVARLTNQDPNLMRIEGITDKESQGNWGSWRIRDVVASGQHLRTYVPKN